MTSADVVRRAASRMRERAEEPVAQPDLWPQTVAPLVADWLESEDAHQFGPTEHAINVALAYLGESSA